MTLVVMKVFLFPTHYQHCAGVGYLNITWVQTLDQVLGAHCLFLTCTKDSTGCLSPGAHAWNERKLLHFFLLFVFLKPGLMVFTAKLLSCRKPTFWWYSYFLTFFSYVNIVLTLTVDVETLPKLAQLSSPLWSKDIFLLLRHRVCAEMRTNLQNFSVLDLKS